MQVVRQSQYGDGLHSCKYAIYLSSTEFRDIRNVLVQMFVPFDSPDDEVIRQAMLRFFSEADCNRCKSILNSISL